MKTWKGIPVVMYTKPRPGKWLMQTRDDEDLGLIAYQCATCTWDVWPELLDGIKAWSRKKGLPWPKKA